MRARLRARWWQRVKAWLLWEPFRPMRPFLLLGYCPSCLGTCRGTRVDPRGVTLYPPRHRGWAAEYDRSWGRDVGSALYDGNS